MAFVKLDTGILDSSLWIDRTTREVFITALLMASPFEVVEPIPQLEVRALKPTGFLIPPGWYGFIKAAGVGIVGRSMVDMDSGLNSLEKLGAPEAESRSQDHGGRRMVRVDGGYIVLNYMKYRDYDHTAAERQQRLRQRRRDAKKSETVTRDTVTVTSDKQEKRNTVTLQSHMAESREQKADTDVISSHTVTSLPETKTPHEIKPKSQSVCEGSELIGSNEQDQDAWDGVKTLYPVFHGRQNWIMAQAAAQARVDNGEATWAILKAGVKNYAVFVEATGKTGTQFVLSPLRFFSDPDRPWSQPWDIPLSQKVIQTQQRTAAIAGLRSADEIEADELRQAVN